MGYMHIDNLIKDAVVTDFTISADALGQRNVVIKASVTEDFNYTRIMLGDKNILKPKKVIFNNPVTVVLWEDGTKTIVRCMDGDTYNKERGFLQAYFEKTTGKTKTQANKYLKNLCK